MKPDEKKALALMQHIRAMRLLGGRRRAKSGRRDHKRLEKEKKNGENDRERRKEVIRIAGWKNKQEADMEGGRGYSGVL